MSSLTVYANCLLHPQKFDLIHLFDKGRLNRCSLAFGISDDWWSEEPIELSIGMSAFKKCPLPSHCVNLCICFPNVDLFESLTYFWIFTSYQMCFINIFSHFIVFFIGISVLGRWFFLCWTVFTQIVGVFMYT